MTAPNKGQVDAYEFGPFRADVHRRQLTRDGVLLPIKSRNFSLLQFFLENRGRQLSKGEIIRNIWTETSVGESNLIVNVSAVRKLLGEHPRDHRYILTHSGFGYEFVAPVTVIHAAAPRRAPARRDPWSEPGAEPLQLAILPFRAGNDLDGIAYLPLGLADTLITEFSRNKRISVRSTGTVRKYADTDATIETIAKTLGVDALVDGSIRSRGGDLVVSIQLISGEDGLVRWAETYTHPAEDLFEIQGRITEDLCRELGLGGECAEASNDPVRRTPKAQAHQGYVRGRYHLARFDPPSLLQAIECFKEAIEIEPEFPEALCGLAQTQQALYWYGYVPAEPTALEAKANARRALERNPDLVEAHVALASVLMTLDRDWEGSETHLHQAIALAPNASSAHFYYMFLLTLKADGLDLAEAEARKAITLEPSSLVMTTALGHVFLYRRQHEQALAYAALTLKLDPEDIWARFLAGWTAVAMGDPQNAQVHFQCIEEILGVNPWSDSLLGMAEGMQGDSDGAARRLQSMENVASTHYVPPLYFAMVHFGAGRTDEAIQWLERANRERMGYVCWLGVDPVWDGLRSHPRFQALVKEVGAPS